MLFFYLKRGAIRAAMRLSTVCATAISVSSLQAVPKNNKDNVLLSAGEDTPVPDYKAEADAAYEPYLNEIFPAVWLEDETDIRRASILSVDINS